MNGPTIQQREAIAARGGVLLAAGAGTGKTATLVSRCLRLIVEDEVNIDRLLVVTFTQAAAAEMKQRLREMLRQAAALHPDDARLQHQMLLLETAQISTLHAFGLELVRSHFAELDLDPGVLVLDESVAVPLAWTTVREVVARALASDDEAQVLARHHCGSSAERLARLVLRAFRFYVTQPRALDLLERDIAALANTVPEEWRARRHSIMAQWVKELFPRLRAQVPQTLGALQSIKGYGGHSKTAVAVRRLESLLPQFLASLEAFCRQNEGADFEGLLDHVAQFGRADVWVRGTGKARGCLRDSFEEAAVLRSWHPSDGVDPLDAEWELTRVPTRKLLELAREFATAFAEAKRSRGGVDFTDLEQAALRLLIDDEGLPTAVAREWRERLDHVFVDECQDINPVQDALIQAVARDANEANLFMVGDVKQSIYRFRMAAPELFRRHFTEWPGKPHHTVLPLTENFRSREGILVFTNDLFRCLMAPGTGEIEYSAQDLLSFALPEARCALSLNPPAAVRPGGLWSEGDCRVELHLVHSKPTPDDDESSNGSAWGDLLEIERQAWVVAGRLRDLMEGFHEVWDKDALHFRPMRWSDVGILMRAVRNRTDPFVRAFRRHRIPLSVEHGDFLETLEATDLTCLLRILDNPRQDIALFAVLRSPLVGFTLDELVCLRPLRHAGVWDRLEAVAREGGPLAERVGKFVQGLERWRRLALMTSLTCVLETVLAETGYQAYLFTLPDGPDRVANVRRFLDLARGFDPLLRQGLFRFLRFLDEQTAAGREIEPLPPRQADAVQLLSVHKSKGLEFPVVVVAGIGARVQVPEASESLVFSREWGIAPQVVDLEARKRCDSLVLWQARRAEKRAALAEELRLFYVAVTRARDTLLLVGSFNPDSRKWNERTSLPPIIGVPRALHWVDWIGLWLGDRVDWSSGEGEVQLGSEPEVARLRWRMYSNKAPGPAMNAGRGNAIGDAGRWETVDLASPGFDAVYPHLAATLTPAKTSASALRRLDADTAGEARPLWSPPPNFGAAELPDRSSLSAASRGTVHHVFLEHLDPAQTESASELQAQAERLRTEGILSAEDVAALDIDAILGFWRSPLGLDIRSHAPRVRRELAFTAAFDPSELLVQASALPADPGDSGADFVVVQGSVDLAVILPTEIWIVDFKTDRLDDTELPERAREHERQLRLYVSALERIYGRPVTRSVLYFVARQRLWEVGSPSTTFHDAGGRAR